MKAHNSFIGFVKTTVLGGVFFLLPLVVVAMLLGQALKFSQHLLKPLAAKLPVQSVAHIALLDILAIVALLLIAFLAGLLARTASGKAFGQKLEGVILGKIPGYTLLKSAFGHAGPQENEKAVQAVIVHFDESWMLGFVMERNDNGLLAVFVPGAPTPAAGNLYFLREDQVRVLQSVSLTEASRSIMRLGVGSRAILEEIMQQGWPDAQVTATPSVMNAPTAGNPSA
ncbi:MAG: DUF502 domain-containing protein [Pedobacter sp.]|nr:DUF502 domain-containing protein [Pedobacter sp.]